MRVCYVNAYLAATSGFTVMTIGLYVINQGGLLYKEQQATGGAHTRRRRVNKCLYFVLPSPLARRVVKITDCYTRIARIFLLYIYTQTSERVCIFRRRFYAASKTSMALTRYIVYGQTQIPKLFFHI